MIKTLPNSYFLAILFFLLSFLDANADVNITMPTGGVGISAEKSAGSINAAFTPIGDIIISDNVPGDFTPNQLNRTISFQRPSSSWAFNPGIGTVHISGPTITSASINVTSTIVTITFSTGAVSGTGNSITISGLEVQATTKIIVAANTIKRRTGANGGTAVIAGLIANTPVATLSQVAGELKKLLLVLPGETYAAGTATGKTGTPTNRIGGVAFSVAVRAVDENWNVVAVNHAISFASSDDFAGLPSGNLVNGVRTNFSVILRTNGSQDITVANLTEPLITEASGSILVESGPFIKLQVLLPGEESAPGTATGKTGSPNPLIAGVPFDVTVNAVNANWEIITGAPTDEIAITSSEVNAILPVNAFLNAGTATFEVTLKTASATLRTITATNLTDGSKAAGASGSILVNIGAFSQLLVLLPGETFAPGTLTGKTGNPNIPTRGTAFTIYVRAVDNSYNLRTDVNDLIQITSTDPFPATLPPNASLTSGYKTFSVNLRTAGTWEVTATDLANNFSHAIDIPGQTQPSLASHYFRSATNGNWNNPASWESSLDNVNWNPATLVPTTTSPGILIRPTHIITVTSTTTTDDLTISSGGQLNVNAALTIANGTAPTDLSVEGILKSIATITTTGTVVFQNGGTYQHDYTTSAGAIPTATWSDGSTCEVIGYTNFVSNLVGMNQVFYDFIWNCTNQNIASSGPSLAITETTVRNNFTINDTGIGLIRLFNASGNLNVKNFIQNGGEVLFINSTNASLTASLNITDGFILNGGTLNKGTGVSVGRMVFVGNTQQNYIKTGGAFSGAINFVVNPAAIVNFGTSVFDGSTGTFTVGTGATLITANPNGFELIGSTGSIQTAGVRSYPSDINYTFNGESLQSTGGGLPATVNNLTVHNNEGVILRAGNLTVNGNLAISSGSLDMGTSVLTAVGTNSGSGTLITQNTTTFPIPENKTWAIGISYHSGSTQTIVNGNYNNLIGIGGARILSPAISIAGTFNPGTPESYTVAGSTINFNGAGAQNIPSFTFNNLSASVGGTKTVTGAVNILNVVNVASPAILNANGNLTLVATENTNANIAALSGSADVIGNVNVQVYIGGTNKGFGRGTRLMTTPINDALVSGAKTFKQLKSFTIISNPGGTTNGFDKTNTTLRTYIESALTTAGSFVTVPNINTSLSRGHGFTFYYIGDRSNFENKTKSGGPFPAVEDQVITYTGPINKGNIDISLTHTPTTSTILDGDFLAGNPYPATIDFDALRSASTNLGSSTLIVVGGKPNATYNAVSGVATNGGSRYIQPGQGFYVNAGIGGGTLRFRESQKNLENEPARLLKSNERPVLLSSVSANKMTSKSFTTAASANKVLKFELDNGTLKEEAAIVLNNNFISESNADDSKYSAGSEYGVNLYSLSSDNKPLSINLMPDPEEDLNVKLYVKTASPQQGVKLRFTDIGSISNKLLILEDKYKQTSKVITQENNFYEFDIDANANSFGADRFVLTIQPPKTLPIQFTSFTVQKNNLGAELKWKVEDDKDIKVYEIERSTDGGLFTKMDEILPLNSSVLVKSYNFLDKKPISGFNYYRIKSVNFSGELTFSPIRVLDFINGVGNSEESLQKLVVYPNPVTDNLSIDLNNTVPQNMTVNIYDLSGRKVKTGFFAKNQNIIQDVNNLDPGVYIIEVITFDTNKLIGRSRFIRK